MGWFSKIVLGSGILILLLAVFVGIPQSIVQQNEDVRKCQAAGGEVLKATGKGAHLACVKKEYLLELNP